MANFQKEVTIGLSLGLVSGLAWKKYQWGERSRRNEYYNALAAEQRKQHDEFLKAEDRAYQAWKKGGGVAKTEAALGPKAVEALKTEAAALVKEATSPAHH